MKLRDYQQKAVEGTLHLFSENRSAIVVLPTGCGKTIVFAELIREVHRAFPDQTVLVIAHRKELIDQAAEKIKTVTGLDVDIEMGDQRAHPMFGKYAPVIVSTVQSLNAGHTNRRMEKFAPKSISLLVVDECHHATADSYRHVIDYFRKANPEVKLLGVTATPNRQDQEALGSVFDDVAYAYQIEDAINDGYLVPIRQQLVVVEGLDYSQIKTGSNKDFNEKDLAKVLEEEETLQRIAAPTLEICKDRRAIIFTVSVREAERLAEILNRGPYGVCADWICGETAKELRAEKLAKFKRGELKFMVNVGVLTEGFDDAGVDCVVMARPTKSQALYAQMAGRGTRPAAEIASQLGAYGLPGTSGPTGMVGAGVLDGPSVRRQLIASSPKPDCLIIDFVGNSGRHKLVTSVDILGGKYKDEVKEAAKRILTQKPGYDVEAALEEAQKEEALKEKLRAEQRKCALAKARYAQIEVNPFDCSDRFDMKTPEGKQAAFAAESEKRRKLGLATPRQARQLARRGFVSPVRYAEAKRMMTRIAKREGWAR